MPLDTVIAKLENQYYTMEQPNPIKSLAGENFAGVHKAFFNAMAKCNEGHVSSYGGDSFSLSAIRRFDQEFKGMAGVHFTFNGTGANVFGLSTMVRGFHGVLCTDTAHIYCDESTAPETIIGGRLIPVETQDGKMLPEAIERKIRLNGNPHAAQINAISITQSTEMGTVYSLDELRKIAGIAKKHGLLLHMDGARLYNAAAHLNCSLSALTSEIGIDVLSLGGTKNGMMFGEAVVFFNPELYAQSAFFLKRSTHLISKMRFVSSQFEVMLTDSLWLKIASHTNSLAQRLAGGLEKIESVKITMPVQANAVFVIFPIDWIETLRKVMYFHMWNEEIQEVRLMCSFDLTSSDIDDFIMAVKRLAEQQG